MLFRSTIALKPHMGLTATSWEQLDTLARIGSPAVRACYDGGNVHYYEGLSPEEDLKEIAALRQLLESHAIEQSFASGDVEWEGHVVSAHHKLFSMEQRMKAGDCNETELWKRYDWQFHQALISACGSHALMDAHGGVFDRYLRYQMLAMSYRGDIAIDEHRMLLDCALKRDAATACKVLTAHINGGVEHALAAKAI